MAVTEAVFAAGGGGEAAGLGAADAERDVEGEVGVNEEEKEVEGCEDDGGGDGGVVAVDVVFGRVAHVGCCCVVWCVSWKGSLRWYWNWSLGVVLREGRGGGWFGSGSFGRGVPGTSPPEGWYRCWRMTWTATQSPSGGRATLYIAS